MTASREPDARIGTLAHIDPARIAAAAAAVRSGRVVSLNRPLDDPPPVGRPPFAREVRQHNVQRPLQSGGSAVMNDDVVTFSTQGSSQWDALAHFGAITPGHDGVFFGGAGLSETDGGRAHGLGIDAYAPGIVTRGVLLDAVTTIAGPDAGFLPGDAVIDDAVIRATMHRQGVAIEPGDAVLIYTGFERRLRELDGVYPADSAGIDASTLPLWRDLRIAALVSDTVAVEVMPPDFSVHIGALRDLGLPLGELWALEDLRDACLLEGRYDFFLVSVPLLIPGGFGSTANAVAIF